MPNKNIFALQTLMPQAPKLVVSSKNYARWRPSKSQIPILRAYYEKNKYPTPEQKIIFLNELNATTTPYINIIQLDEWFKKERIRAANAPASSKAERIYTKFSKKEIDYLDGIFERKRYPSMDEMVECAEALGVKLMKIENWFKHSRGNLAKEGKISLRARKHFTKEQINYLEEKFKVDPLPSRIETMEMGKELDCEELQIRHWFANKRKKVKTIEEKEEERERESSLKPVDEEKITVKREISEKIDIAAKKKIDTIEIKKENIEKTEITRGRQLFVKRETELSEEPIHVSNVTTIRLCPEKFRAISISPHPVELPLMSEANISLFNSRYRTPSPMATCLLPQTNTVAASLAGFEAQMAQMRAYKMNSLNYNTQTLPMQPMQTIQPIQPMLPIQPIQPLQYQAPLATFPLPQQVQTQNLLSYKKLHVENSYMSPMMTQNLAANDLELQMNLLRGFPAQPRGFFN